ncbi:MAG: DUF86 domain-containing protein [Syntrophobacteraceae bacterium]|nr:DUF86 domain-containing protein [Syntrophobacteraceae bacterium]
MMVNRAILHGKLAAAERHLDRIRHKRNVTLREFLSDLDRQESILFNLQMAIQNCIDVAAHIVSEEDLGIAGSTNELFYLLEKEGIIDPDLTERMVRSVGFRNLIVHEYGRVDLEIVYGAATENVPDLEDFMSGIAGRFLAGSDSTENG